MCAIVYQTYQYPSVITHTTLILPNTPFTPRLLFNFPYSNPQLQSPTARTPYHSPHSPSSFFPPAGPLFLTALVPMPLGFFFSCVAFMRASPTLENSSQKSCFSFAGPLGASPNESQKSFFSGSRRDVDEDGWAASPSTKRLNVVPALATPEERVWPSVPAVRWAWVARSASASCISQSSSLVLKLVITMTCLLYPRLDVTLISCLAHLTHTRAQPPEPLC